jgi:NitT/TauT family transport system substrate-binding protein
MKNLSALLLLLFFAFCFTSADAFSAEPIPADTGRSINKKTDTVRLAVQWIPQTQFAGIFVAVEKGYLQKYIPNKKVEIVWPRSSEKIIEEVGSGEIEFATCWFPEALHCRILYPENKIVLLSQITWTTPIMLVAHSSDGIKKLKDLDGRRIQTWRSSDVMVKHLFRQHKVCPVLIPQSGSMMPFLYRCVDAACAMYYNEYHTLLEHGLTPKDIQIFRLSDFGFDFPGDGIYCLEKTYLEQPEICKGIAAAIQDGWKFAVNEANEAETIDIVKKYIKKADAISSRSHQRWMLRTFKLDLTAPYGGEAANGSDVLKETDFDRILNLLKDTEEFKDKKITSFPKYSDFYPCSEK